MTRRLAVAALLLVVAGCGQPNKAAGFHDTPSPSAAATSSPPRALDEYDAVQRLVGALNEAGIACVNWERTDNPLYAKELGSCYVGTEEVVTAIYSTHEGAAAEPEIKAGMFAGLGDVDVVVGGNWTLSCDSNALCSQIEDKFGGELVHIDT